MAPASFLQAGTLTGNISEELNLAPVGLDILLCSFVQ